jgi:hypothetical protein
LLDCVTVKGSKEPIRLYTFDIARPPEARGIPLDDPSKDFDDAKFVDNASVAALQEGIPPAFLRAFDLGVHAYLHGDWAEGRAQLEAARAVRPEDGPTATLLEFMGSTSFIKPMEWEGYRELTEK